MEGIGAYLAIALAVLAIATAAGFGLQKGRVGRLQGQLDDSDKELERQDRRRERAEQELEAYKLKADAELRAHKADSGAEISQLKTELAALARVVTGEAHWTAIGEKLDVHHDEATTHWLKDENLLTEIRDLLLADGRNP